MIENSLELFYIERIIATHSCGLVVKQIHIS